MGTRPAEILLVASDRDFSQALPDDLTRTLRVRVTVAASADDALREELTHRHDAVLADLDLAGKETLALARQIRVSNRCPFILMASEPGAGELIEAMRLGIREVLIKPFPAEALAGAVRAALQRSARQRRHRRRCRRLRLLTARIIRERRDLRQRTDLICRDLVSAYRDLARKVAESGILAQS